MKNYVVISQPILLYLCHHLPILDLISEGLFGSFNFDYLIKNLKQSSYETFDASNLLVTHSF